MRPSTPVELLSAAATPAFLITNPVNLRYLSGITVSTGALLITPKAFMLFVDGRYGEGAKEDVRMGISVRSMSSLVKVMEKVPVCGCESETVTLSQYGFWKKKFKNTKFIHKRGIVSAFRRAKDSDELRAFRKSQRITQRILEMIPTFLRPGISECELAWKIRDQAHTLGADDLSFDPIVGFGSHTSRPHHHPTNRKLKSGDIVQIDCGVKFGGYCSDQSRVFFTGKMSPLQEKVLRAVTEAKEAATRAVKIGITTHELDRIARKVLRKYGLEKYFVHSLGHGVGLDIHEGVTLSSKRPAEVLQKNEIITIEPGVYIPGKFGMRMEDEVVVR
ncbi:MAG: aminopeptidase P family protein [Candidatus Peregrinibacteria bacterium]